MEIKALLGDGAVLGGEGGGRARSRGAIEWIRDQRSDRGENQRREVKHAGGEDLRLLARREGGDGRDRAGMKEGRAKRADHLEILHAAASFVELKSRFFRARRFGGRGRGRGRRGRGLGVGNGVLRGCFGGAGEHLDDVFEGGGVSLDEGGRIRVSVDGSWGRRFGRRCRRSGRSWDRTTVVVGAATTAGVWGRDLPVLEIWVGFHCWRSLKIKAF